MQVRAVRRPYASHDLRNPLPRPARVQQHESQPNSTATGASARARPSQGSAGVVPPTTPARDAFPPAPSPAPPAPLDSPHITITRAVSDHAERGLEAAVPLTAAQIGRLVDALGPAKAVTDPERVTNYCHDEHSYVTPGRPCAVVLAESAADVQTAVRWAAEHRVPVIPRGAGTGIVGGTATTDGCLVVSVARMKAVRELSPADEIAVVEPGVVNADLDRAARAHGLMYAPDPSSYETCTIGGNIATNAGGLRCVKYGVTRDSVLGLEAVLADGSLIRTGRRTVKGVAGYDLTGLLVGSEGTLGIVTEATLRLRPAPRTPPVTVAAEFPSVVAAAEAVWAIVRRSVGPSLLELMDRATLEALDAWRGIGLDPGTQAMLLCQADGPGSADAAQAMARCCEDGGASIVVVSDDEAEAEQ